MSSVERALRLLEHLADNADGIGAGVIVPIDHVDSTHPLRFVSPLGRPAISVSGPSERMGAPEGVWPALRDALALHSLPQARSA